MKRWLVCLCVATFVGCADGGPGTESPGSLDAGAGEGGMNAAGGTGGGAGGAAGSAGGVGGTGGAGGVAGNVAGVGGIGGAGGIGGEAGAGGVGGTGGVVDEDGGVDDEGFCTVECTGIGPDEGVSEACSLITAMTACEMHETGGFPAGCRWVTPESEPCLAP